jgi:hypothetical protein
VHRPLIQSPSLPTILKNREKPYLFRSLLSITSLCGCHSARPVWTRMPLCLASAVGRIRRPLARPHRERFSPLLSCALVVVVLTLHVAHTATRRAKTDAGGTSGGGARAPLVLVRPPIWAKPSTGGSGSRASPLVAGSTLSTARINWPWSSPFYVAHICFNCFRRFKCMLKLFHFDVAKVNWGVLHMLYMLQVFQMHVASICSKCFIYFQNYVAIVFDLDVAYVSHICCNCMFQNVSAISVSCCSKWFYVASCKCCVFGYFVCSTYILQVHVPSISSVLRRMLLLIFFSCCKCFIVLFGRERGGEQEDRAGGLQTRALGVGWSVLRLRARRVRLSSAVRSERPERVWIMTGERRYGSGVRAWDVANLDEGGTMADWGGLRWHPSKHPSASHSVFNSFRLERFTVKSAGNRKSIFHRTATRYRL